MKTYKKIDIYIKKGKRLSHGLEYLGSTIKHKTCKSARASASKFYGVDERFLHVCFNKGFIQ